MVMEFFNGYSGQYDLRRPLNMRTQGREKVFPLTDLCCLRIGVFLADFSRRHVKEQLSAPLTSEQRDHEIAEFVSPLPSNVLEKLTPYCSLRSLDAIHELCVERHVNAEPAWADALSFRWALTNDRLTEPTTIAKQG